MKKFVEFLYYALIVSFIIPTGTFLHIPVKIILILSIVFFLFFTGKKVKIDWATKGLLFVVLGLFIWSVLSVLNGFGSSIFSFLKSYLSFIIIFWLTYELLKLDIINGKKAWKAFAITSVGIIIFNLVLSAVMSLNIVPVDSMKQIYSSLFNASPMTMQIELFGISFYRFQTGHTAIVYIWYAYTLISDKKLLPKILSVLLVGVFTLVLFSRFTIVEFVLITVAALAIGLYKNKKFSKDQLLVASFVAVVAVVTIGAVFYAFSDSIEAFFSTRFNSEITEYSDSFRDVQGAYLFNAIINRPIFGYGAGAYLPYYVRSTTELYSYEREYLSYLFQFGVVGFIWIVVTTILVIYLICLKESDNKPVKLMAVVSLFFWTLQPFFNPSFISSNSGIIISGIFLYSHLERKPSFSPLFVAKPQQTYVPLISERTRLSLMSMFKIILLILTVCASVYLAVGSQIFGPTPAAPQEDWHSTALFILSLTFFALLLIYLVVYEKYHPSVYVVALLSLLLIAEIAIICTFPNNSVYTAQLFSGDTKTFTMALTPYDYFHSIVRFVGVCILSLIVIDIIPKHFKQYHIIEIAAFLMFAVTFVAIVYSLIVENQRYIDLFNLCDYKYMYQNATQSFFVSKNNFGMMMMISIFFLLYFHNKYGKIWFVLFIPVLLAAMFFTQSKNCIFVTLIALSLYGVFRFIYSYKQHKLRNIITLSSFIAVIAGIFIALMVIPTTRQFVINFSSNLFQVVGGESTLDIREVVWNNSIILITQYFNLFSGVGFGLFNNLLLNYNNCDFNYYLTLNIDSSHNFVVEMLGYGGIVFLLVWLALFAYVIYCYVKSFKKNKAIVVFSAIILISYLIFALFENGLILLSCSPEYLFITLLVVAPISYCYQSEEAVASASDLIVAN